MASQTPDSMETSSSSPWELIDLQDCLHDSPQFRQLLEAKEKEILDLEKKLRKVVQSCTQMVETGQNYMNNYRLFGMSLKDLSSHFSEQPVIADALIKFCDILNEVQSFYSVLFDQAQNTVIKGLKSFLTGELRKARDSKKSFHRISEELNSVAHKNASMSRHKPLEAEELTTQLQTTLAEFTHGALDYSYQINLITCNKGHLMISHFLSFMRSFSNYYHQGYDIMKQCDPFVRELTTQIDDLKLQSDAEVETMEGRHSLVSVQHLQNNLSEHSLVILDNPSLPIELSGYLFKRASSAFKMWNRRYFELRDNKFLYLKKASDMDYAVVIDDLRICTVKLADELERRFCFEVVSPSRSCILQADTEPLRRKWCHYLEAGIARALRITSSNKSRETRRRLTSSGTGQSIPVESSYSPRMDSPLLVTRSDTPSSFNSMNSLCMEFLDIPGNDKCADCCSPNPKWASINLGILLCIDCSGLHRSLGVHITKVRSVTLDDWDNEHQKIMNSLGNHRVNGILEYDIPSYIKKPASSSPSSEKEPYIRLKYISHAFVHSHPDFERPEVPVPPRRMQGTFLNSVAATSPKLAGRLNRPISMVTGIENHLSPLSSLALPSGPTEEVGGVRAENLALLEANLRKLEKTGKLHQWNKRINSVVRRSPSPRKQKIPFSFSRFTRPSSFRRKKSPLVTDDSAHSDNELESRLGRPLSPPERRPPKPPRTYITTVADVDSKSLFESEDDQSFSSDLLSTFEKLGSVYNMNVISDESPLVTSSLDKVASESLLTPYSQERGSEGKKIKPHMHIQRSYSAMESIDTPPLLAPPPPPTITIIKGEEEEDSLLSLPAATKRDEGNRLLLKHLSYSDTSLDTLEVIREAVGSSSDELVPVMYSIEKEFVQTKDGKMCQNNKAELREGSVEVTNVSIEEVSIDMRDEGEEEDDRASLSSFDSFQSAMETTRPDSVASELFHTPPRSLSPDDLPDDSPDLEAAVDHTLSMGRSLGIITGSLDNTNSEDSLRINTTSCSTIKEDNGYEENYLSTLKRKVKCKEDIKEEEIHIKINKEDLIVNDELTESVKSENESIIIINNEEEGIDKESGIHSDTVHEIELSHEEEEEEHTILLHHEDETVIIPDNMSPTKYIFECSLSGDIPGILCGLAHNGSISSPDLLEGKRYPVHQACIAGNETTFEFLYQNGAKINVSDERGLTPLHLAVLNDDSSLAAMLLKRGADYKSMDANQKTPLTYAMERENGDLVTLLKVAESGIDENMEETVAGIYKDYSMGGIGNDSEKLKHRSLSSTTSTPSYTSSGEVDTTTTTKHTNTGGSSNDSSNTSNSNINASITDELH